MSDDQRSIYLEGAHDSEPGRVCPSCEQWHPECEYAQDRDFCDACEEAADGEEKLKPCPFCGSSDVAITPGESIGGNQFFALCPSCAAEGPWHKTESGAMHLWNRRPSDPVKVAMAEALENVVNEWDGDYNGFRFAEALKASREALAAYKQEQAP